MRAAFLCCCGVAFFLVVSPLPRAQAWFVSIDGSVSPSIDKAGVLFARPDASLVGRVKIAAGVARGHWHLDGSISFFPVPKLVLYKNNRGAEATEEAYPLFVGTEARYYVFSSAPFSRRHDMYVGLGADFPVLAASFVPGLKIGGGYSLRLHRRIIIEMGVDYYYFGALTNELFVGLGFKSVL